VCNVFDDCVTVGPFGPYKVDRSPPTITLTSPTAAAYTLGQAVTVAYRCADVGAGIASCTGTQPNGAALATGTPGTYTFTVTATDLAGNTTTSTVTYTVSYAICPLSGAVEATKSEIFVVALCNAKGQNVTAAAPVVTALNIDGTTAPVPTLGFTGDNFEFLGQYLPFPFVGLDLYAISTSGLAKGSHVLNISIAGDPVHHAISFTV
jgi:hypothetical protein